MARGTAIGEPVVSQANTRAFEDGYQRIFGDRRPQRGRWVWDEMQNKLVAANEYQAPQRALNAPILANEKLYEGAKSPVDGADISTRKRYREYLKATGLACSEDFKGQWGKREQERAEGKAGRFKRNPDLRHEIGRAIYELENKARHRR